MRVAVWRDDQQPVEAPPDSNGSGTGRCARLVVEDTGSGIDNALLPRLFDMFRQGEIGGQRQSGLGIGLALVKTLVEMHEGRIWAESDGPGKGARFTIELPLVEGPDGQRQTPAPRRVAAGRSPAVGEDGYLLPAVGRFRWATRWSLRAPGLERLRQARPDVLRYRPAGMDSFTFCGGQ